MKRFILLFLMLFALKLSAQTPNDSVTTTYNGHTYTAYYFPTAITWTQANTYAQSRGGYLASVTSAEENTAVWNLIQERNFDVILGGHQPIGSNEPSGGWEWASGEQCLILIGDQANRIILKM